MTVRTPVTLTLRGAFLHAGPRLLCYRRPGPKIRIQGTNCLPGRKDDLFVKSIQRIILMAGPHTEPVSIEGSSSLSSFCSRAAVRSPTQTPSIIQYQDQAVLRDRATLVQIAVEARNAADPPKLAHGHRRGTRLPIHRSTIYELSCPSVYV
ncbi:hypothetical protein FIBSPDRAFT_953686 [Athelia psychrophila]|uniref:Uncharacterized protein n=1 Tax=Athelia psychrophila TaxID=1759441 RepID=A0A166K1K8_9AGAM|nr:hypothetical protein FIBSPDRAFT_953686 [Fibularhizoctonia sp. CBS 109695]